MDEPYRKAMATIDRHLASAAGLAPAKTAAYRAAAEKVIRAMGLKALERWNENVESITFYPDIESIDRLPYPKASPKDVRAGLCIRRKQPDRYSRCQIHVDGGDDTGETARASRVTYAHEFAHAIDVKPSETRRLSSNAGWKKAWDAEKDEVLRSYGIVPEERNRQRQIDPQEGFALFGGIAWNYSMMARRQMPQCWAFWAGAELV
jgi:hypothetical protein